MRVDDWRHAEGVPPPLQARLETEPALNFIRAALRARWLPDMVEDARAIAGAPGFDWRAMLTLAARERVAPIIHAVARRWLFVPAPVAADLRMAYMVNAARNLQLNRELHDVLRALVAAGVKTVVLKGPALAQDVYQDDALRVIGDLDLLVAAADLDAAMRALRAEGYTNWRVDPRHGDTLALDNEILLVRRGRTLAPIELHWSLFDSPYYQAALPVEWFLDTAVPGRVADGTAWVLAPAALVLHLCAHLSLHHGRDASACLLWRHDVAEVLHRREAALDWDLVLKKAVACDLVVPLQAVLPGVAALWRAPVPAAVLERLAALQPTRAERRVHGWLSPQRQSPGSRLWADLLASPDWTSRLRRLRSQVLPSPAYMRQRYGWRRELLLLTYPYRWIIGVGGLVRDRLASIRQRGPSM